MLLQMVLFHCIYVPHLLYPFICRWTLSCFLVLAIVNSAAMKIGVHVSFWIRVFIFSRYMPRNGIAGSYAILVLIFKGISILFSIVAAPIYVPTNSVEEFAKWVLIVGWSNVNQGFHWVGCSIACFSVYFSKIYIEYLNIKYVLGTVLGILTSLRGNCLWNYRT